MSDSEFKAQLKKIGVYIVIGMVIGLILFVLASNSTTHDKNNHHDNICDNCGRTATYHVGNSIELCRDCANSFYNHVNNESKKRGY